ncbi:MAG: hypothetical protein K6G53_04495 [Bacteroidales bacterium]|nr:hypothetical protein [Bacteroidales bacterium]
MAFSSCHKREGYVYATSCTYFIDISFKDSLGNDLVAPLAEDRYISDQQIDKWWGEIDPERYKLEIISQSGDIIAHDRYSGSLRKPQFFMSKYDSNYKLVSDEDTGCYYLEQILQLPAIVYVLQQQLTYRIICPTIFGDDNIHEIITYWDFSKEDITPPLRNDKFPECYGIIYEDQRLVPVRAGAESVGNHYGHFVNLVVDR